MAGGVTWTDRQPTDWLASNGKWYASTSYPRGWDSTALPPAPGHGGVSSILKKYTNMALNVQNDLVVRLGSADSSQSVSTVSEPPAPPLQWDPPRAETPPSPGPSPRREPPRTKTPPSPGRSAPTQPKQSVSKAPGFSVEKSGRSVADATVEGHKTYAHRVGSGVQPPAELPPPSPSPTPPVKSAPSPTAAAVAATSLNAFSNDFGKVLGGAKDRIEKAINDAYEGQ